MTFSSVALLVDGDNIAASYAAQIIRKTENLGHHRIRRAYCDSSSLVNWANAGSFRSVYSGAHRNSAADTGCTTGHNHSFSAQVNRHSFAPVSVDVFYFDNRLWLTVSPT